MQNETTKMTPETPEDPVLVWERESSQLYDAIGERTAILCAKMDDETLTYTTQNLIPNA